MCKSTFNLVEIDQTTVCRRVVAHQHLRQPIGRHNVLVKLNVTHWHYLSTLDPTVAAPPARRWLFVVNRCSTQHAMV